MSDDDELKAGLKKSMSEPAKKKKILSKGEEFARRIMGDDNPAMHDKDWQSKFDRNRG